MTEGPVKDYAARVRQAVLVILLVAAGVRIAWSLLAPLVPVLVSLAVVLTAFGLVLTVWRSK